jgi:hypothetical protein
LACFLTFLHYCSGWVSRSKFHLSQTARRLARPFCILPLLLGLDIAFPNSSIHKAHFESASLVSSSGATRNLQDGQPEHAIVERFSAYTMEPSRRAAELRARPIVVQPGPIRHPQEALSLERRQRRSGYPESKASGEGGQEHSTKVLIQVRAREKHES